MSGEFQQASLCEKCRCFNYFCNTQAERERIVEKAGSITENTLVKEKLHEIRHYDINTYIHSIEVGYLSLFIGQQVGFKEQELKELCIAAILHDYGKTKIPIEIINKPGPLDIVERGIVEVHTTLGAYHLRKYGLSDGILDGIYEHHESFIGSESGYPRHLVKNEIHIFARIIAVADKMSAFTQNRVYHEGRSKAEVVEFLRECNDLDKEIVDIILQEES